MRRDRFLKSNSISPFYAFCKSIRRAFYFLAYAIILSAFIFARDARANDVPIMACDFFGYETRQGGIKVGDIIIAEDPDGVMCGSYIVISDGAYGFLSCSGDNPDTVDIDEGAVEGDTITFFINGVEQVDSGVWREGGMVQVDLGIYRLSVSVAQSSVDFGSVAINTITVIKDKIVVTNDGDGPETYLLNLTNPKGWIAGTENGNERYVLNAAFSKDVASIKWDPSNHALSTEPVECSSIRFTGDETGFNVPAGEERILWLQFMSPVLTQVSSEQEVCVTISAEAP